MTKIRWIFRKLVSKKIYVIFLLLFLSMIPLTSVLAQGAGDLIISPTRIVFEDRDRTANITLANRGSERSVFRISLLDMVMNNEGQIQQIEEGDIYDKSAAKLIRYAPRQITLEPGATQVVRLSLRKPAGLLDGEYRSHIFFRAVPPESAGRSVTDDNPLENNELRIQLTPIYGITIPMIVRQGDVSAKLQFLNARILPEDSNNMPRIDAVLSREGNGSTFGDVTAIYQPADGSEQTIIGKITRLAVYTDVDSRRVIMPLQLPQGDELSKGRIELLYHEPEDIGGKLITSTTINLF